jgi:selenocysteine lyase/cysteine desulfurase
MSLRPKPYQKSAPDDIKKLLSDYKPIQLNTAASQAAKKVINKDKLEFLRQEKIGRMHLIDTPDMWVGNDTPLTGIKKRPVVHLDYTASAQTLGFIERYMLEIMKTYGNTHTETSACGRLTTQRVKQSLDYIRSHVGAGKDSFVIPSGYGATGAIEKLQNILGLYLSPRGQKRLTETMTMSPKVLMRKKVVVFVGPSEHHSNDVSWQDDALCDFVRIRAIESGPLKNQIDLDDLEKQLHQFKHHIKIGSFNAASNVTGIKNPLKEIGALLKAHNALFLVDYAASGPYADINMSGMGIDAIFLSGHKNLGGTNLGVLIAKNSIYDHSSSPSFGGGGTVSVVTPWEYRFHNDIEEREIAGTPAIRQIMQVSLSFEIKQWIGHSKIHQIESVLCKRFIDLFNKHPNISLLGSAAPEQRYPIFSYLVRHGSKYLHHSLIAALLNDAFGIQARSGCACAGPYGHRLLNIDKTLSDKYMKAIEQNLEGLKPGWTRIGAHYTLSEAECDFAEFAISATAFFGPLFLADYNFNLRSGQWVHRNNHEKKSRFSLEEALRLGVKAELSPELASEKDLYRFFDNQKLEFKQIVAVRLLDLILEKKLFTISNDQKCLAILSMLPLIDALVSLKKPNVITFLEDVVRMIEKLKQEVFTENIKQEILRHFASILIKPEENPSLYESFETDIDEICFYYIAKGRLQNEPSELITLTKPN